MYTVAARSTAAKVTQVGTSARTEREGRSNQGAMRERQEVTFGGGRGAPPT